MNLSGDVTHASSIPESVLSKRKRRGSEASSASSSYSASSSRARTPALSDAGSNDDFASISQKISTKLEPVQQSEFERLKAKLDQEYQAKLGKLTGKLTNHFSKKIQNRASRKLIERDARVQEQRHTKKSRRTAPASQPPVQPQLMASPSNPRGLMQPHQASTTTNTNPQQLGNPYSQNSQMLAPAQMPVTAITSQYGNSSIYPQPAPGFPHGTPRLTKELAKAMMDQDPDCFINNPELLAQIYRRPVHASSSPALLAMDSNSIAAPPGAVMQHWPQTMDGQSYPNLINWSSVAPSPMSAPGHAVSASTQMGAMDGSQHLLPQHMTALRTNNGFSLDLRQLTQFHRGTFPASPATFRPAPQRTDTSPTLGRTNSDLSSTVLGNGSPQQTLPSTSPPKEFPFSSSPPQSGGYGAHSASNQPSPGVIRGTHQASKPNQSSMANSAVRRTGKNSQPEMVGPILFPYGFPTAIPNKPPSPATK